MRKTRFKMMLVAAFAAFAMLFGAKDAVAQTGLSEGVFSLPTGNFVNSSDAVVLLTGQVGTYKGLLETLTPGTQAYYNAERSTYYYITILNEVEAGKDIPVSIVSGLEFISADGNSDPYGGASKTVLFGYRQDAINLLKQ